MVLFPFSFTFKTNDSCFVFFSSMALASFLSISRRCSFPFCIVKRLSASIVNVLFLVKERICLHPISKAFKQIQTYVIELIQFFNSCSESVDIMYSFQTMQVIHTFHTSFSRSWNILTKLHKKKRDNSVSVIFTVTVIRLWHSRLYFNSCFDSPLSFEYWHLSWLWRMENMLCSKNI